MSSLALTLWVDSCPQALGALPNLFQCRFKSSQLFRARIGKDFPNFGSVFPKNRGNQSFAFWGERYDPNAPILRTLDPAYPASIQQAVDGHTDRAGRKVHLWADRIYRQRPFVEECFQYPEVGIVDSRLLKSRIEIFRGRPKGLPQYQPTVNRVSRVLVHDQTILTLCITNVHKNVSKSIELTSIDSEARMLVGTAIWPQVILGAKERKKMATNSMAISHGAEATSFWQGAVVVL